jgi:hypothetical protein
MKTEGEANEVIKIDLLRSFYNLPGNERFKRNWAYCDHKDFWILMKGSKVRCGGLFGDGAAEWSDNFDVVRNRGIVAYNVEDKRKIEKELEKLMEYENHVEVIW